MSAIFQQNSFLRNFQSAGSSAKKLGQTSTRQAGIAIWERQMKVRKEQFGPEVFDVMERNRSMGDSGGGETETEVIIVFKSCVVDVANMQDRRGRLQSELTRQSKPQALCYKQSTGESTVSEEGSKTEEQPAGATSWFQRGLRQAKESVQRAQATSRIKTEIAALDNEILERKKKFGVEMYEMMAYLVDNYEPKDPRVKKALDDAKKDISVPLDKTIQAEKEIHDVRTTGEVLLSHSEIHQFVDETPTSWAMLQVNIGMPEEECREIAYRVCVELASGKQGEESRSATITKNQFQQFRRLYIDNPKGSQEFFHRCVFAAFDSDQNGVLDKAEIDKFLDTFYVTGSIFEGDIRLPTKEELKELILEKLDENGDGEFDFDEIRSLISGSATHASLQE